MNTPWYAVEDVSKILGLSKATLWNLKNIGSLEAGKHWLYFTGKKNSNVRFNVEAILQQQLEQTIFNEKAPLRASKKIATYQKVVINHGD